MLTPFQHPFKPLLPLALLPVALFIAGCFSEHNEVTPAQLPADWMAALPKGGTAIPDISGTYADLGQSAIYVYSKGQPAQVQIKSRGYLLGCFFAHKDIPDGVLEVWQVNAPSGGGRNRKDIPDGVPDGVEVQLQQHGAKQLEATARRNGQVLLTHTFDITIDRAAGAVVLSSVSESGIGGNLAAATLGSTTVRLFKGTDGALYFQNYTWSKGVIAAVVPFSVSEGWWVRWTPMPTAVNLDP